MLPLFIIQGTGFEMNDKIILIINRSSTYIITKSITIKNLTTEEKK